MTTDIVHQEIRDALKRIECKQDEQNRILTSHGESLARVDEHLGGINGRVGSNHDKINIVNDTVTRWKGVTIGVIITLTVLIPTIIWVATS